MYCESASFKTISRGGLAERREALAQPHGSTRAAHVRGNAFPGGRPGRPMDVQGAKARIKACSAAEQAACRARAHLGGQA